MSLIGRGGYEFEAGMVWGQLDHLVIERNASSISKLCQLMLDRLRTWHLVSSDLTTDPAKIL